jgi:hypothetical protein
MITKLVEIRDVGTTIPALAIQLSADSARDAAILRRAGYGKPFDHYVLLIRLAGEEVEVQYDPYQWSRRGRTMREAHRFINAHFDEVRNGAVIDVQYLLGERPVPKLAEIGGAA